MDPELERFKRKIVLARIAAGLVVILLVAGFFVSQWYGSESGTVAKLEYQLKQDHSKTTILDALLVAEKLKKNGNTDAVQKIESAADSAMGTASMGALEAAKANLDMARELQKRAANLVAHDYAFKVLSGLDGKLDRKAVSAQAPDDLLNLVDSASVLMIETKIPLDAVQQKTIVDLADAFSDQIVKYGKDHVLDLALSNGTEDSKHLTDSMIRCMYAKDLLLAQRGQASELEKSFARASEATNDSKGAGAICKSPEPCLLTHCVDLALTFEKTDPLACSKYLLEAETLISQIDKAALSEPQKIELASSRRKMSEAYLAIGYKDRALACAQEGVTMRPLCDEDSGRCVNQLLKVMVLTKQYKDAEQIAISAYKFFKDNSTGTKNESAMFDLRADCVAQLFQIDNGLRKNALAISTVNSEIKEQQKHLPESAQNVVKLSSQLADSYLSRNYLKAAGQCVQNINNVAKTLKGVARMQIDMIVINYAPKIRNSSLAAEASSDALAFIAKNPDLLIQQEWLDEFCTMLDSLEKAGATDEYNQALDVIKTGFSQQLASISPDPILLAKIVNQLGVSGSEQTADQLRSQAVEKLPDAAGSVFKARAMDFVVSGEKDAPKYSTPEESIDIYLDLAQNMKGKDAESSFRYAFEANKIMFLLASKIGEYRDSFLDRIDEASSLMITSKLPPNRDQLAIIDALAAMEKEYIKKSGKDRLLDLLISAHAKAYSEVSEDVFNCLLLKDEILAKKGSVGALDAQLNRTRSAAEKLEKNGFELATHIAGLAQALALRNEPIAARRYLSMSSRIVDSIPSDKMPDSGQLFRYWNLLANTYSKSGDAQGTIDAAKKALAVRPIQDLASANLALMLADRLGEQANYAAAEPITAEVLRYARNRPASPDMNYLRVTAAKRLFRLMLQAHKESEALSMIKEELGSSGSASGTATGTDGTPTPAPASAPASASKAEITLDLANYYLMHGDLPTAKQYLDQTIQSKALFSKGQKADWEKSTKQRDLIVLAVQTSDPKLASQFVDELCLRRDLDKPALVNGTSKWWKTAIEYLGTNNEERAKEQLIDLAKGSISSQLSRSGSDPSNLADMVMDLNALGATEAAMRLRDLGRAKLSGPARETFLARCKDLPESPESSAASSANSSDNSNKTSGDSTKPLNSILQDERGRIDE